GGLGASAPKLQGFYRPKSFMTSSHHYVDTNDDCLPPHGVDFYRGEITPIWYQRNPQLGQLKKSRLGYATQPTKPTV
ncbi:MAG TPA: hypothetical protein ACFE0H_15875, partial [Elainellaceae cyanobacterium]